MARSIVRYAQQALAVGMLLGGCAKGEGKVHTVQAAFGNTIMTLNVADDLEATALPGGGIRLAQRDAAQRRRGYEMTLVRAIGDSPVPLQQTHGTGNAAIRYGVEQADGGSGGPEVTLIAERRCLDVPVRLRLDLQLEDGVDLNLDPVLSMLADARCKM